MELRVAEWWGCVSLASFIDSLWMMCSMRSERLRELREGSLRHLPLKYHFVVAMLVLVSATVRGLPMPLI